MLTKPRRRKSDAGTGKVIGFQVPFELLERIDVEADHKNVNRSVVLRWALLKYFESHKSTSRSATV